MRSGGLRTAILWVGVVAAASHSLADPVAPGVTYTQHNLEGPVRVHVLAVDRVRSEYAFEIGWAQGRRGFTQRAKVSEIASLYHRPPDCEVLAAVNASVFESTGSAITGVTASGGELLSRPSGANETFVFGPSRVPLIVEAVAHVNGIVTFPSGATVPLHQYNQPAAAGKVTAYTPAWGPTTGTSVEGVELVLENVSYPIRGDKEVAGIVAAVRTGSASRNNAIPDGGMVLSAQGAPVDRIVQNLRAGDRVRVRFDTSAEELNNADLAVTGIGWLVHNGAPNIDNWLRYASSLVDSRNPRTIVAWNNTQLFLVVVDGRSAASVGMSFAEAAEFLIAGLNATEAVNLDGGGSSTMVVGGSVRNSPADGAERPVANALLLVRRRRPLELPFFDPFGPQGRLAGWDDKFAFNGVVPFSPAAPEGDGYVIEVMAAEGVETVRRGCLADADYWVEADVFCEYRPGVRAHGFERYGLFARDNGNGAFDTDAFGGGNCYALTYDSNDGRIRAGVIVNGLFTDFLENSRIYETSTAWRRLRIECTGTSIGYYVDGRRIATALDTTHPRGYYGLAHHEYFGANGYARGTRADCLRAGRTGPAPGHTPYFGRPFVIPGLIEAEAYDIGEFGGAWYDRTAGNAGGLLRSDDVDIESCVDDRGGFNVGWFDRGEWLEYTMHVPQSGPYDIRLRVAALAEARVRLELDGRPLTGPYTIPATEGRQNWTTVTIPQVTIEAGDWRVLRVVSEAGPWGLNYIEFTEATPTPTAATAPDPPDGAADVDVNVRLRWKPGQRAESHDLYFGTVSPGAFVANQVGTSFEPVRLEPGTTYFWRVDEVSAAGVIPGPVWRFTTRQQPPGATAHPEPGDYATDVPTRIRLRWSPGAAARSHAVYLGALSPGEYRGTVAGTSFEVSGLFPGTTYYWRVDAMNDAGVTPGAVWLFRTRYAPADFDRDADVDLADFAELRRCFNGEHRPPKGPDCADQDMDADGDVDLADFTSFQKCFNGSDRPAECRD